MIYSVEEIKKLIFPILSKYKIKKAYLFGSYAKGSATEDSDVDLLVDDEGSDIKSLLDLSGFLIDCKDVLGKEVDVVTLNALNQEEVKRDSYIFIRNIMKERVKIYDRERSSNIASYKATL